jgi:heme/copper-type cytochrome/quinol oxidase subunit 3
MLTSSIEHYLNIRSKIPLYESLHIIGGVVYLVFGGLGSYYVLKTLTILHKSPELSKTQRRLWLPILISTLFFAVGGVVHLADHTLYPDPLMEVLFEIVIITGVSFFTVSVLRYSQLQIEYYTLKDAGLKQIRVEEPLQVETQ